MTPRTRSAAGRLRADRLRDVLVSVCGAVGLDPTGAELLKFTNNAVFSLAEAPVVVRIAGSAAVRDSVGTVVEVARWLERNHFPAVRLLPGVQQPTRMKAHVATLWEKVPAVGPRPAGADLGVLLRDLHTLPTPTMPLPGWQPFGRIRRRIDDAEGLDGASADFLRGRCDELEDETAALEYELPSGVIHGDAFLGNLIPGPGGPVICDFDSVSVGPREWDLVPMAVGLLRFDYPIDDYTPLARTYGFDVTAWSGFPVMRRLRELKVVTSVLPVLRSNPGIAPQFQRRLESLIAGDDRRWATYA